MLKLQGFIVQSEAAHRSLIRPLGAWTLPEEFATLRRLLEARMGKSGKREFVQVMGLMEAFE
jgi:hypothetical protein